MQIIERYIEKFRLGEDVGPDDVAILFDEIIGTTNGELLTQLLVAWNRKGFAESELFNFSTLMRQRMIRVQSERSPLVDIVGTGAAAAKTFNVSTAAAFIIAGAGVGVAKHGNRAATSRTGSADALAQLGIDVEGSPSSLARRLQRDGICFLFAPNHHALSATLAAARRDLGEPTIFNCLGPLCNPASPTHTVIGVSRREWLMPMANTLARLGTMRSWVVFGECGLDELALTTPTTVAEINNGRISTFGLTPADFAIFSTGKNLPQSCNARESAQIVESILSNASADSDVEALALINAAAAIYMTEAAGSLPEACELARNSVRGGSALAKLNAAREEFLV